MALHQNVTISQMQSSTFMSSTQCGNHPNQILAQNLINFRIHNSDRSILCCIFVFDGDSYEKCNFVTIELLFRSDQRLICTQWKQWCIVFPSKYHKTEIDMPNALFSLCYYFGVTLLIVMINVFECHAQSKYITSREEKKRLQYKLIQFKSWSHTINIYIHFNSFDGI